MRHRSVHATPPSGCIHASILLPGGGTQLGKCPNPEEPLDVIFKPQLDAIAREGSVTGAAKVTSRATACSGLGAAAKR